MIKIGLIVFNKVEELDFIGPYETLSYINKLKPNSVSIKLIAEGLNPITAYNGLRFLPDCTLKTEEQFDILVIAGGKGRKEAAKNIAILEFIKNQSKHTKLIASVCTGAFILAETGLVNGLMATTHYLSLNELKESYHDINVVSKRVVKNDGYWFAAGISSGIDLSLEIIKTFFGKKEKEEIARRLEYSNK